MELGNLEELPLGSFNLSLKKESFVFIFESKVLFKFPSSTGDADDRFCADSLVTMERGG